MGTNCQDESETTPDRKPQDPEAALKRLREELDRSRGEAIHDQETSLISAAYFQTRLQEEILRSERYRHFLSLILMHVELKHGGTSSQIARMLRQLGRELMANLTRRTDIIALYQKRQMIVMLPETDPRGARLLLHRFQSVFADNGRHIGYGLLTYPKDASNIEMVLTRLQETSENLFRQTT